MVQKSGLMAKMKSCPVCGQKVGLEKLEAHVKKVHPKENVEISLDKEEVKTVRAAKKAAKTSVSTRGRWIALAAMIVIIVVVLAFVFFPRGLGVGSIAPDFTLTDVRSPGVPWNLKTQMSQLQKPILLEFFHPDCSACKGAMPELRTIYNNYVPRIEMVSAAITLEVKDFKNPPTVDAINTFIGTYGPADWTFIFETSGTAVRDLYEVTATPTYYLIGTDGRIAYEHQGGGDAAGMENAIKRALQ